MLFSTFKFALQVQTLDKFLLFRYEMKPKGPTPATANLERNFSTLGLTYGKLRSQLGVDKAGKLAFLTSQFNK